MTVSISSALALALALAAHQDQAGAATRAALIEQAQARKATDLRAPVPGRVEAAINRVEDLLVTGGLHVHPFFESAYAGGGFTLGAGYVTHVSSYNVFDVRGSWTFKGYKRIEAAFLAPRLFDRRATLSVIGGWREATQVGFYGVGMENTSKQDRANYSFDQPYAAGAINVWPTRKLLVLRGGVEVSEWSQGAGSGPERSVEEVYTAATLPGLGASPAYLHTHAGFALDSRPSAGYARRGGTYELTFHDFRDHGGAFGFRRTDYEVI